MAKRTKTTVVTNVTPEEVNKAMADFAIAEASINKINADLDVKITKIREGKADELLDLTKQRDGAMKIVQSYATENKGELFTKKKSVDTVHGTYGFRTGTPKLKNLRGFTWASIATLLKELAPNYIREKIEADKDKILADREKEGFADKLESFGIEVVQDETFYIEPKTEETNG